MRKTLDIHGGAARYRAILVGVAVFVIAFTVSFCASISINPVGESFALETDVPADATLIEDDEFLTMIYQK